MPDPDATLRPQHQPPRRAPDSGKLTTTSSDPVPDAPRVATTPVPRARSATGYRRTPSSPAIPATHPRSATSPRRVRRRRGSNGLLLLSLTVVLAVIAYLLFGKDGLVVTPERLAPPPTAPAAP